jgi:hypothetical protein
MLLQPEAWTNTSAGRKQYGPSQTVGGSKGANDQAMYSLAELAGLALKLANSAEKAIFEPYIKAGFIDQITQLFNRLGGTSGASSGANVNW